MATPASTAQALLQSLTAAIVDEDYGRAEQHLALLEEAIAAIEQGDTRPFLRLHEVLKNPWEEQTDALDLAEPPGEEQFVYKTFCGT